MYTLEKLEKELKNILSEKRFKHSIGTRDRIIELAQIYNIDVEKAAKVGLMHDVAKEMTAEEKLEYAKKNNIEINKIEQEFPTLLHSKIGAHICAQKYEFTEDMQNAISCHTTGKVGMDMLSKILYMADKTEKNRIYPELEMLKEMTCKDIDAAILFTLDYVIDKKIKEKQAIHIDTILTRNDLLSTHQL